MLVDLFPCVFLFAINFIPYVFQKGALCLNKFDVGT